MCCVNNIEEYAQRTRTEDRQANFDAHRRVRATTLADGTWISTVCLMIDHNWSEEGPPIVFETMVFPYHDRLTEIECERYATYDEAVAGHEHMCAHLIKERESK